MRGDVDARICQCGDAIVHVFLVNNALTICGVCNGGVVEHIPILVHHKTITQLGFASGIQVGGVHRGKCRCEAGGNLDFFAILRHLDVVARSIGHCVARCYVGHSSTLSCTCAHRRSGHVVTFICIFQTCFGFITQVHLVVGDVGCWV